MQCKLCKQNKEKLCKAHITPEAFYRYMYPDGKIEGESLLMLSEAKDYTSQRRIGLYDNTILCADCDGLLGKNYDQYGIEILLRTEPKLYKSEFQNVTVFDHIDTSKLKLFFLSVLWRASISQLAEYNGTYLPEKFENRLHQMIVTSDPGDIDEFSIVISRFAYMRPNRDFHKFMQVPQKSRMEGLNYYNLYFSNGYKVTIKVDSRPQPEELVPFTLTPNKPAFIVTYESFENTKEYQQLLDTARRINRK